MTTRSTSIFNTPNIAKYLSLYHYKYGIVSADNAIAY